LVDNPVENVNWTQNFIYNALKNKSILGTQIGKLFLIKDK